MNTLLWIVQGLLAFMMLMPGALKLTNDNAQLKAKGNGRMDWADDISGSNMKLIDVVEVAAAFGLILPMLLNILPILTPLAAIGVIMTMLGAIALHVKRKDGAKAIIPNIMIITLAIVVLYGRFALLAG